MKKYIALIMILLLSIPTLSQDSIHEDKQSKTILLDTNGNIGHLIYEEQYFSKNETGYLIIEQDRIYYNGDINQSKVRLSILRPLMKDGNPYPENQIKAIAFINNETILNTWYQLTSNENPSADSNMDTNIDTSIHRSMPGFNSILTILIMTMYILLYKKKTTNTGKIKK